MWNRRTFILSFVFVTLIALLAYGGIVFVASMVAIEEIGHDTAWEQWTAAGRSLDALGDQLRQIAAYPALTDSVQGLLNGSPSGPMGLEQNLIPWLEDTVGVHFVLVTDQYGKALFAGPLDSRQADALKNTKSGRAAFAGQAEAGVSLFENRPLLVAAVPVKATGSQSSGVLILGRWVDDATLMKLRETTGRDLYVFRDARLLASSRAVDRAEEDALRSLCIGLPQAAGPAELSIRRLPDSRAIAAGQFISSDGLELGCLLLDVPNAGGPTMRNAIAVASFIAVLLGLAASYIMARAIGGRLSESAEALAARELENARLYAEVQKLNARLESMIGERTTQLRATTSELQAVQTQLIQADRMAAMGSLTASIFAELATPINAILSAAQGLLATETDPARARRLDEIRHAAVVSQELAIRLRTFAGRQRVRRELINLNDVVREAADLVSTQLRQSDITLRLELAEDIPRVMVDRIQTQQVLLNLITNAREALDQLEEQPKEPPAITVRTERTDSGVRLSVMDNGPGLQTADIPHIFEPFFTSKPSSSGTGLGLYISESIVEAYGGTIRGGNRAEGRGALFEVELPGGIRNIAGERLPPSQ